MEATTSRYQESSDCYSSDSSAPESKNKQKSNNTSQSQGAWQNHSFYPPSSWQQNFLFPSWQWGGGGSTQSIQQAQSSALNAYNYNAYALQNQRKRHKVERSERSPNENETKTERVLSSSSPQSNDNTDNSVQYERNISKSKETWTVAEIKTLYAVVIKATAIRTPVYYPIVVTNWQKVSENFKNKTASACEKLWQVINPDCHVRVLKNNSVVLCTDVKAPPTTPQAQVQQNSSIETRIPTCLVQNLGSDYRRNQRKAHWTARERENVHELQKQHGNKWTFIATKLGTGKTSTEIKNYWNNKKYRDLKRKRDEEEEEEQKLKIISKSVN